MPLETMTGRLKLDKISHVVSSTSDFPQYEATFQHMLHVVKPSWVDVSILKGKATNPRQYSPDPSLFMTDVVLTCADIPEGDKEAIHGGLLAMGGQYLAGVGKPLTHIVALTMDNPKCEVARRKDLKCKIVLPHWYTFPNHCGRH